MSPRRVIIWAGCLGVVTTSCGGSSVAQTRDTSSGSVVAVAGTGNPSSPVNVREDGSTLLFPLLQEYVTPLHEYYPNITFAPAPGGSGKGIADAFAGLVDMGGSDAYLDNVQAQQHPDIADIPIAISAEAVNYNVPGVTDLKLTGDVLAGIYEGQITRWNDPSIAALNPGSSLPGTRIVPVRRADSSGNTFIFTQFLTDTSESWRAGPAFGTTVPWPTVPGERSAPGNPAMVTTCVATPGCVAYVGVSAEQAALESGLGEALLQNRAGTFLRPDKSTIKAAVEASIGAVPGDLRRSLIYFDGPQSYPIINFEYVMVNTHQSSATKAQAIRTILAWMINPTQGNSNAYLTNVNFVPLPDSVIPKGRDLIASISS